MLLPCLFFVLFLMRARSAFCLKPYMSLFYAYRARMTLVQDHLVRHHHAQYTSERRSSPSQRVTTMTVIVTCRRAATPPYRCQHNPPFRGVAVGARRVRACRPHESLVLFRTRREFTCLFVNAASQSYQPLKRSISGRTKTTPLCPA